MELRNILLSLFQQNNNDMNAPLQVIRVEHPVDKKGVWRSATLRTNNTRIDKHSQYSEIVARHNNESLFPTYHGDDQLKSQIDYDTLQNYKFAFKSIEQLNTAFTADELKEIIIKLKFKVYLFTVTDYFQSDYQVVFSGYESKEDISSLFI